MNRGDTPTITYKGLPCDSTDIADVKIYLYGSRRLIFERENISIGTDTLQITLTQEQTLSFSDTEDIKMQIRLKLKSGQAFASNIMITRLGEILEAEVI